MPPPEHSSSQPTVLLRHTAPQGVHHDWLIARPGCDRLWTARVQPSSADWARLTSFTLTRLPPHRRLYLTYEGPLTDGRGHVERVDEGTVHILDWQDHTIRLEVAMDHFVGRIDLQKCDKTTWSARVV